MRLRTEQAGEDESAVAVAGAVCAVCAVAPAQLRTQMAGEIVDAKFAGALDAPMVVDLRIATGDVQQGYVNPAGVGGLRGQGGPRA